MASPPSISQTSRPYTSKRVAQIIPNQYFQVAGFFSIAKYILYDRTFSPSGAPEVSLSIYVPSPTTSAVARAGNRAYQ
jgi:hypothetical protein